MKPRRPRDRTRWPDMHLRVLSPFRVFLDKIDVCRVVVETPAGSYGLLPHRLDCVAALVPGILTYESPDDGTVYIAVDEGTLIKAGPEVLVSVRRAIGGTDLDLLHAAVRQEFLALNDEERAARAAMARLEGSFVRRVAEFEHER